MMDNIVDMDEDTRLCYEFQKRYAALHPNDMNACHNIYLCKSVDENGNVTDVKYGMNTLTNWGLWYTFTNYEWSRPQFEGSPKYWIDDHSNKRNSTLDKNSQRDSYVIFGIGDGLNPGDPESEQWTDYPNPEMEVITNAFGKDTSFVISNYYHSANDEGYQDFTNGVITATVKLIYGYFDYQVYGNNNVKYTEPVQLGRIGILQYQYGYRDDSSTGIKITPPLLQTYSYIYDENGNKSFITKKPNEKLYVTIYATATMDPNIHNRLWDKGVYAALPLLAFLKTIAHYDTSYIDQNTAYALHNNLGNGRGWYVLDNEYAEFIHGGSDSQYIHWQQYKREWEIQNAQLSGNDIPDNWNDLDVIDRLKYWYGDPNEVDDHGGVISWNIPPRTVEQRACWALKDNMNANINDLDFRKKEYAFLYDTNVVNRQIGDYNTSNISKLFEGWQDYVSHVAYTDQPFLRDKPTVFDYNFWNVHYMAFVYPLLPEPEELSTRIHSTYSAYDARFLKNAYGYAQRNHRTGNGGFPVSNFTMTSLKRYNYFTDEWDINESFETHPENVYDQFIFNHTVGLRVMVNGSPKNAMVYINAGYHYDNGVKYPGWHDILKINNSDIKQIYCSDTFWDPASWVLIDDRTNISNDLEITRNYLLIPEINGQPNPLIGTHINMRHTKYYIMTNPVVDMHSNTSSKWFDPYTGNRYDMNPTFDRQYDKILNSEPLYLTRLPGDTDALNPLVYRKFLHSSYMYNTSFKMLGNDNPGTGTPIWTVMGECVCYWNNDITNVTNVYPLIHNFQTTAYFNNAAHACTSRWRYKNHVMIQQEFASGHFVIYALNDPNLNDPNYTIQSWNISVHDYVLDRNYDPFTLDNGGRYFGHWLYNRDGKKNITTINSFNKSWLIDMGDEDTFIPYETPDVEPSGWPIGWYTKSGDVYTRVSSDVAYNPNTTYYHTMRPRAFEFPNAMFMVPVLNTSYVITRIGSNTDGGKCITIFDASIYRTTRETLEAERALLPDDDPARKTDQEIHEESFIASIVNRFENTNYTFEIPLSTTDERPIVGAFGFNNFVYIRFSDGNIAYLWYYNIITGELMNLAEVDQEFRDRVYFRGNTCTTGSAYLYEIGDDYHWYTRYHPCTVDGSTGNGIFVLSFNQQDASVVDNDTNTWWRAFYVIEENNPTTIRHLTHKIWQNAALSVANCDFDIKIINDKELVLYTMLGTIGWDQLTNSCYGTSITVWDLGYWRNHKPDNGFDDANPFARADQPYIAYYTSTSTNVPRYIDANTIIKDKMIMVNGRDKRIDIVPVHNFMTHKVTGTTTTIQCFNNPKEIQLKCPFSIVWSNTGLQYKTSWMGVPDFTTIQLRYNIGRYTEKEVRQYVIWHVISEEQYQTITGQPY